MSEVTAATTDTAPAESLSAVSTMLGNESAAAPAPAPAVDAAAAPAAPAAESLAMPGKDATPEQWGEFYTKLGRPEAPDGYEMEIPEGDDGAFAKAVSPLLHKAGITGEQAKTLSQGWNQMKLDADAQIAAQEAAAANAAHVKNTAEAAELKTAWGQQFDANMHYAKMAATQFLPEGKAADVIAAVESKLGYKATIEFLHNIGKGLGEHDAAGLGSNNSGSRKSTTDVLYNGT